MQYHWGIMALSLYWICAIFWFVPGSLEGDEAIYAQVLRETIARDSFLTLYWRGEIWMEKPPLFFWIGILLTKLSVAYEYVGRYISGGFGYATILLTYFAVYSLYRDRIAALVAAVCPMSLPLFIEASRYGILDMMLTFFVFLACISLWKFIDGGRLHWLYCSAFATACGVMTKSAVGLIPVIVAVGLIIYKPKKFLKARLDLIKSMIFFLGVTAPWHLYMHFSHPRAFVGEYFGYHVLERFDSNYINSPYSSYTEVVFAQFGIWVLLIPATLLTYFFILGDVSGKTKRRVTFLLVVSTMIYGIFSLSQTKVPFYILPVAPFLAVALGVTIHALLQQGKYRYFHLLTGLSLLHFLPIFFTQFSDVARVNILIPQIVMSVFIPSSKIFYGIGFGLLLLYIALTWLSYTHRKSGTVNACAAIVLVGMSTIIPFSLDRSNTTKEIGDFITTYAIDYDISTVLVSDESLIRSNTLLLYTPLGVAVERTHSGNTSHLQSIDETVLCVTPAYGGLSKNILHTSANTVVFNCNE